MLILLTELKDKTKKELQENKDNQAKAAIEDAAIKARLKMPKFKIFHNQCWMKTLTVKCNNT